MVASERRLRLASLEGGSGRRTRGYDRPHGSKEQGRPRQGAPRSGLPAVAAQDHAEAVAWLFVSLEAAIVAVADAQGLDTKKAHWKKAEVAAELHATGVLPTDYADTLKLLNEARKAVFYDGEDPDLADQSLQDIASIVESAVEQAEQVTAR